MFVFIVQRKLFGDKFQAQDLDKEFDKMLDVILFGISKQGEPITSKGDQSNG